MGACDHTSVEIAYLIEDSHLRKRGVPMKFAKMSRLVAALSVGAVALTACGSSESAEATDDAVHIVYTPFDEGVAAPYLWKHIFEEQGYDVELTLADVGPTYAAVSQDDADFYFARSEENTSELQSRDHL